MSSPLVEQHEHLKALSTNHETRCLEITSDSIFSNLTKISVSISLATKYVDNCNGTIVTALKQK
ncbi:hypothetical protein HI914_05305 [Erysiphe necator]|nr:hypothetical protein HI914_05305 [Erysiphe necator]